MVESFRRITAMFIRHLYLHQRSVTRSLELFFWPVMELLVWGFVSLYIQTISPGGVAQIIVFLINSIIFWDILYRSQQGVSVSFVEEVWTRNILNLLISPLKIWEWLAAIFLYGAVKTAAITVILAVLAATFYHFDLIGAMGFYLLPLAASLLLFGWTLGIVTSGLLIRWGHAAEALIWGVPFLIQPLSAIYYPLSVLPASLQAVSRLIPSTYVFEGMRSVIQTGQMPWDYFFISMALNVLYFLAGTWFFQVMYRRARVTGRLGRLGMD
ncbi:MAG: ABC transporter permease [Deltaproteobacteria bacterium]|nr:ABC transporter permease [Deltaproteobacteria bacterium]